MIHALIVGSPGVGKSTLIRRIRQELGMPVFGYETKKEDLLSDPEKGSPLYIYPAGAPHVQGEDNLLYLVFLPTLNPVDHRRLGQVQSQFKKSNHKPKFISQTRPSEVLNL